MEDSGGEARSRRFHVVICEYCKGELRIDDVQPGRAFECAGCSAQFEIGGLVKKRAESKRRHRTETALELRSSFKRARRGFLRRGGGGRSGRSGRGSRSSEGIGREYGRIDRGGRGPRPFGWLVPERARRAHEAGGSDGGRAAPEPRLDGSVRIRSGRGSLSFDSESDEETRELRRRRGKQAAIQIGGLVAFVVMVTFIVSWWLGPAVPDWWPLELRGAR